MSRSIIKSVALVTLVAVINGCSPVPSRAPQIESRPADSGEQAAKPKTTAPKDVTESVPVAPETTQAIPQNPAVIALLDQANSQSQQGDLQGAQTSLQRAQRIAPRDPQVYFSLAQTHLELADYSLAEQVALKGVSLVQGRPAELKRFWLLIAKIRYQAGDTAAAEQAQRTAEKY
jgi:cytochrome c-type biogenesis protein CcmH/NrfG